MEPTPTVENTRMAVHALHTNPNPAVKEAANKWLTELQGSVFAWEVADALLHEKTDMLSCYFAAQTIRNKIQSAFHEVPVSFHEGLRNSLLQHVTHITVDTDHILATQLCVAMADLALQMLTWENPALDMIRNLVGDPPGLESPHLCALLEVLRVLPEELSSRHFRLGQPRREALKKAFLKSFTTLVSILNECVKPERLQIEDVALKAHGGRYASVAPSQQAIRCLTSWLELQDIPTRDMIFLPILSYVCSLLVAGKIPNAAHERAVDCVSAAMYVFDGIAPGSESMINLARWMQSAAYSMVEAFHLCVAEEEADKIMGYARIFVDLVDCLMRCIVHEPNVELGSFHSLDLLLLCVGHHDYEVAGITFNAWFRLSEELYQVKDKRSLTMIRPYVLRLILALCRHVQMEPDHEGLLEKDTDFEEFRGRVQELVRDVLFIIGADECFSQMHSLMLPLLQTPMQNGALAGGDHNVLSGRFPGWETVEACLFIMAAVARQISTSASEVVRHTITLILNLPPTSHPAVRYTAIQVLGELSHWVEENPHCSDDVMKHLLNAVCHQELAPAAASALEQLCMTCRDFMGIPHVEVLFVALKQVDGNRGIPRQSAVGLLVSIVTISSRLNPEESREIMRELFHYHVGFLSGHCAENSGPGCNGVSPNRGGSENKKAEEPILWLDRLAVIGRHMNPNLPAGVIHPCRDVVIEMWPVIEKLFNNYSEDARVMERACRCIRFLVRSVSKQCAELLEPLVPKLVEMYGRNRHGCFLYLGSVLVDEFGSEKAYQAGLINMLQAFLPCAFDLLKDADSRRNHPDTLDDLFRLCARFIQRMPVAFLQCARVKDILDAAVAGVLLDHKDANVAIMKFWMDFIGLGLEQPRDEDSNESALRRAVTKELLGQSCGSELVKNITYDVVGMNNFNMSHHALPDFSEAFHALLRLDRPQFCLWFEAALRALHSEVPPGTAAAVSQQQIVAIHRAVTSAENPRMVTRALKDLNHLYQ